MSQISLTASMRSNLLSLQNTSSLMDQTQERLSTGNKVNSAIDNPSSYYTAQSLNNRASDLNSLLDSMGQAISTIKAADEGIEAITSFVEQAKAVASSALDSKDAATKKSYMDQFNDILDQIDALAKDSGYKGVNLINGDSLDVTFNEDRTSKMTIAGQDATTTGLGLSEQTNWMGTKVDTTTNVVVTDGKPASKITANTDTILKVGDDYYKYNGAEVETTGTVDLSKATKLTAVDDGAGNKTYYDTEAVDAKGASVSTTAINTAIDSITNATSKLRTMSSALGNNYSIVETRQDFTENLVNVLEEGADKLTLADMNEESANMLALQTRQQLAINSLSLASQASQSVLSLF